MKTSRLCKIIFNYWRFVALINFSINKLEIGNLSFVQIYFYFDVFFIFCIGKNF